MVSDVPATTPELPAELVEEILLRFPPGEPVSLVRAALVCKPWCRIVSGRRFRRSFREFHRTPPMAGFLCSIVTRDGVETARFMPTTSTFRSPLPDLDLGLRHSRVIDARHGRVLVQCPGKAPWETVLVVWDPVSDERRELPVPTRWAEATKVDRWRWESWNAVVLCAAADSPCDHLDCHCGPFLVIFVDSRSIYNRFISTYSSVSGTWSDRIVPLEPTDYAGVSSLPCAHVGNALYFASNDSNSALKYDLCLHKMSKIYIPYDHALVFPYVLTTTEDGRLRYTVLHRSKLYMWSRPGDGGRDIDARCSRDNGWKQDRVIELKTLLRSNAIWASPRIVGFADGAGVIFLTADDVHFTLDLNTKTVKKVSKDITVDKAFPYMSFCIPGDIFVPNKCFTVDLFNTNFGGDASLFLNVNRRQPDWVGPPP